MSVVSPRIEHMFESIDDAEAVLNRAALNRILHDGPGPASLLALDHIDVDSLDDAGRLLYLQAWEQQAHWVAARPLPVLVDFVGAEEVRHGPDAQAGLEQASAVTEVALTLGMSEMAVNSRVCVARDLLTRLPATQAALLAGDLSFWHARALSESTSDVSSDEALATIEDRVLDRAIGRPVGQFRRAARAAVDLFEPAATVARSRKARNERTVRRWALPDGMACLNVEAPAPEVEAMWSALTSLAGAGDADDPRSLGARRSDAMLGLCLGAVATEHEIETANDAMGRRPRVPVQVHIVVDLPTLLGLADNACELRGYGPIPAGLARDWLQQATTWRRLVTDPVTGHLLDYGPVVRQAPPKLRDFSTQRYQTCVFPHCPRPAVACDLDHEPPWRRDGSGGHASANDLRPLCRRHHRYKTFLHWNLTHANDSSNHWRSPAGRELVTHPPAVITRT